MPSLTEVQRAALADVLSAGPKVSRLTAAFAAAGHELYLVGGSVRDALMGRLGNDLDYTTSAHPDAIEALVRRFTKAVWDVGRAFGTIACRITEADGSEWLVEITTFRADVYVDHSRKPEVAFGDHLAGDLVRRDFTVNAMALNTAGGELLDPFGGLGDLAAPGDPDAGRRRAVVLRRPAADDARGPVHLPARASSRTPDVVAAMTAMAPRIEIVSAERIRDELVKLLLTDNPRPGLNLLVNTGLAEIVLPELPALRMEADEHNRHKDVYEHTLTVLDQAIELEKARGHAPDIVNRLAALLHDIGKPKHPQVRAGRQGVVPPPRRGRGEADPQAAAGAALLHRGGQGRREAGRAAPALPRLRRGPVDRLGRAPLRPRCR